MEQERARELLTEQLRQMDADARRELHDRASADAGENAAGVMDFGDAGAEASEKMDRDLTVRTLRRRRDQTEAALARIDEGTFGACRVCGAQIDDERLEIRPETEFCREHAEGPGQSGPVEP